MNKEWAIIHYRTAMAVFRKWLTDGVITEEELTRVDAAIAGKYGLSPRSIYR